LFWLSKCEIWREENQHFMRNPKSTNALRLLVTGFEPFGGASFNPSGDVARGLHGQTVLGHPVIGRVLPVVWNVAPKLITEWIEELRPNIVVALGMARDRIEIETRATNRRHPERRDNLGALPDPPRATATHVFSTALPAKAIEQALSADGPVEISEDAGAFLCEEVFYAVMAKHSEVQTDQRWPLFRAGFIHVPNDRFITNERARQGLESRIVRALEVTIEDARTDLI